MLAADITTAGPIDSPAISQPSSSATSGFTYECVATSDGAVRVSSHLYAHATRYRLSELIGGTDGAAMRAVADDWLAAQGVREPATMMRMLLPSRDA
jgi:hypothetical protein